MMKKLALILIIVVMVVSVFTTSNGLAIEQDDENGVEANQNAEIGTDSALANLDGTEWVLISFNDNKTNPDTRITLNFSGGIATGFAGCNWYSGDYTSTDAGVLTLFEIASTVQLCEEPEGIMEQEERYLGVFFRINTYTFEGDQLTLMTEDGRTLVYKSGLDADAEPAERLPGFGIFWVVLSVGVLFISMRGR